MRPTSRSAQTSQLQPVTMQLSSNRDSKNSLSNKQIYRVEMRSVSCHREAIIRYQGTGHIAATKSVEISF